MLGNAELKIMSLCGRGSTTYLEGAFVDQPEGFGLRDQDFLAPRVCMELAQSPDQYIGKKHLERYFED